MADSALIEIAPDGSGKVVKYNCNIPTDGWITTLGKKSMGARIRPDIHNNYLEDMIIPDNITTLDDGAIEPLSTDCFAISLPRGLKVIKGRQDFGLTRIKYRGTVKQWKAVEKNPDYSDHKIAVECTDGTIYECGDPDAPFTGLEKIGGCVVNLGDRCVAAFDNSFYGDIVIPELVKFINPYSVGIPCEKIVLGNGRNLVLHPSLEYVNERAVCAADADFQFIMDKPGDRYCVLHNMLVDKSGELGYKIVLGWFGEDAKVEPSTIMVAPESIMNTNGTDIFIPEGIELIDTEAIRRGKFGTIRLPKSLTWLEYNPFGRAEFDKFYYAGTVRRWKRVVREKHWAGRRNEGKGKTVVCSDGEVPVEDYKPSGFYEEDGD